MTSLIKELKAMLIWGGLVDLAWLAIAVTTSSVFLFLLSVFVVIVITCMLVSDALELRTLMGQDEYEW
jgi:hypothetical protein